MLQLVYQPLVVLLPSAPSFLVLVLWLGGVAGGCAGAPLGCEPLPEPCEDCPCWLSDMENSSETPQVPEHSNIKLIYSYTEYRLKLVNDSLNALNTKLGSIIAFSGAAIGFSINLPNKGFGIITEQFTCYSCLILKILVCLCLVIAICISMAGFYPKAGAGMTPPRLLMDNNYYGSEEECRLVITKTWLETLDELEHMRDIKAEYLKKAIFALGGAAILAAIDIILASLLPML